MKITEQLFGEFESRQVVEYTMVTDSGMSVSCLNFGCVITKIMVPDRNGKMENVVLGFDNFNDYVEWSPYFGAACGRVVGRIKDARFELDGKEFILEKNEGANHLHGGQKGFNSCLWQAKKLEKEQAAGVKFFYHSPDGEEGYPGNLETAVTYLLTKDNELQITFEARTDQKTLVNLTNHSYFNLSGHLKRDIAEHILQLESDRFLELGPDLIPTGKWIEAEGTPFDFSQGRKLRDGMNSTYEQNVLVGNGYDHPLIFSKNGENSILLKDEGSGRTLEVTTDQPCVVLYTGNSLEGPYSISGVPARNYLGVCLETQGFPDAIHHPEFPSIILNPEEVYFGKTTYRFFVNQ
ncbi:aldose epimerase family protein [Neobacillus niacini]|uniref:aldose epimerase family protein n=1 Tax=Neobacillus niacini TaxID=86668 RepID=UPI00286006AC|nr:aldose epimerase family protein [Neobacillus niacini]MDR7001223.1 aldose 1-epimerase [Neobacillus niacini]